MSVGLLSVGISRQGAYACTQGAVFYPFALYL